jgi:hypothetical protein
MILHKDMNDEDLLSISSLIGGCDLEKGPWISGGAARLAWFGQSWHDHDVDLFFPDIERFESARASLLRMTEIENREVLPNVFSLNPTNIHETSNAITFTISIPSRPESQARVQIIRRSWHSSLQSMWSYFDFTACKFATDGKTIVADPLAVEDCRNMRLRMNPSCNRTAAAIRTLKYSIYGFEPDASIMAEIIQKHRNGTLMDDVDEDAYA